MILMAALKQGRQFLDAFDRHCMVFLEGCFLSHSDSIIGIIKTVQLSTRALQVRVQSVVQRVRDGTMFSRIRAYCYYHGVIARTCAATPR